MVCHRLRYLSWLTRRTSSPGTLLSSRIEAESPSTWMGLAFSSSGEMGVWSGAAMIARVMVGQHGARVRYVQC